MSGPLGLPFELFLAVPVLMLGLAWLLGKASRRDIDKRGDER